MEKNKTEHQTLKVLNTTTKDFLTRPKEFISKLIEENFGKIEIKLGSKDLYVLTSPMFDLFVKKEVITAVRKERLIFEDKYRALKERFTKAKDEVEIGKLTKAEQVLLQLASKFHLFDGLSDGELLTVIANVKILRMERGEKVFIMNNTSKEMFFIIGGSVGIMIHDFEVAVLPKSSFFGEMSYIANKPRNATAVVKTSVAILLSFTVKDDSDSNQSEAFMKLFRNINNMLVGKIEEMNKKAK